MLDPFILKALLAGLGIALMAGPLGCFVAWQRMAYFGDTVAHSALLGVVLALLFNIAPAIGIMAIAMLLAMIVARLHGGGKYLAFDTLLGIAAHGALALGLVILSLSRSIALDINGLLFGDILAVSNEDIMLVFVMAALGGSALISQWRPLLKFIIHPDIAQVEGVNVARMRLLLMLLIAASVAVSIKIVGMLLITSLLIIPAAAVRFFSRTPTQMALAAIAAGMVSVCGGLYASLTWDTPTGPSIILAALALFLVAYALGKSRSSTTGT